MIKVITKILRRFGYIRIDGFHNELREVVFESARRHGETITFEKHGFTIEVSARNFYDF